MITLDELKELNEIVDDDLHIMSKKRFYEQLKDKKALKSVKKQNLREALEDDRDLDRIEHLKQLYGIEPGDLTDEELEELRQAGALDESKKDEHESLTESVSADLTDIDDVKQKFDDYVADSKNETEFEEVVVDPTAEVKDDLYKAHIGDVVLRCPACQRQIFIKSEDVRKNETPNTVDGQEVYYYNSDIKCEQCNSEIGYEIVGQMAKYEPEAAESAEQTEPIAEEPATDELVDISGEEPAAETLGLTDEEQAEQPVEESLEKKPALDLEKLDCLIEADRTLKRAGKKFKTVSAKYDESSKSFIIEGWQIDEATEAKSRRKIILKD